MTTLDRTIRLFVSSTFRDLSAERDALHTYVFSRLRDLCSSSGYRFQPVDLRWGISGRESASYKTLNICLAEISRCQNTGFRPNFMALVGQRYGWRPLPQTIPEDEFPSLIAAIDDPTLKRLAEQSYRIDHNAVPPQFVLQLPRSRTGWHDKEQRLREALWQASRQGPTALYFQDFWALVSCF